MKKKLPQTSILNAMKLLQSAWSEVSELTINNCFRKCGISEKSAEQAINEEDNPFKDITADLEETISLSFANDCPKKPGRAECN